LLEKLKIKKKEHSISIMPCYVSLYLYHKFFVAYVKRWNLISSCTITCLNQNKLW